MPEPHTPSQRSTFTDAQIVRAAAELASQERYNPNWCKPGVGSSKESDTELYRQRAQLILMAALDA